MTTEPDLDPPEPDICPECGDYVEQNQPCSDCDARADEPEFIDTQHELLDEYEQRQPIR